MYLGLWLGVIKSECKKRKKSQFCRVAQGSLAVSVLCKRMFPRTALLLCTSTRSWYPRDPIGIAPASTSSCPGTFLLLLCLFSRWIFQIQVILAKIFSNHQHQLIKPNNAIILELKCEWQSLVWNHSIVLTALVLGRCLPQCCSCCLRNTEVKYKYRNCLRCCISLLNFICLP